MAKRKGKQKRKPQGHPAKHHAMENAKLVLQRHRPTIERMAAERGMAIKELLESIPDNSEGQEALDHWLDANPPDPAKAREYFKAQLRHSGARLRELADAEGLTVDELVEKHRRGGRTPEVALMEIATKYGVSLDELTEEMLTSDHGVAPPDVDVDLNTMAGLSYAGAGIDQMSPKLRAELTERGIIQDARAVVGGEGAAAELAGMLTDKENRIIGTLPDTPASKLSRAELERLSGYEFAGPGGASLTLDEIARSVFPSFDMAAEAAKSSPEMAEAVWEEMKAKLREGLDEMVADGRLTRNADGWSATGSRTEMRELVAKLAEAGSEAMRMNVMREHGLVPLSVDDWTRLDKMLAHNDAALREVREAAPTAGVTEDGELVGLDDMPAIEAELKRILRYYAERDDDRELHKLLTLLGWGMGELAPTQQGREWRAKTAAGLRAAAEQALTEDATLVLDAAEGDAPDVPDPEAVAAAIVEYMSNVAAGWGISPVEVNAADVQMRVIDGALHVRVTGALGETVGACAQALGTTPEGVVQEALRDLVDKVPNAEVQAPRADAFAVTGSTPAERLANMAVEKMVHTDWPPDEDYSEAQRLDVPEPIRLTYVGLATLVSEGRVRQLPRRVMQQELRHADPQRFHEVVAAWRIQHPRFGTFVRTAITLDVRRGTSSRDAMLLHDVEPNTWEALRGVGAQVPVSQTVDGLDAGFPREYRLGSEDRPRWAGARAFDKVWDRCQQFAAIGHRSIDEGRDVVELCEESGEWNHPQLTQARALIGYANSALSGLKNATEVLVDPDQVNAMPAFDNWDHAVQFAKMLHLPFDEVFLDMEGPAGACAFERAEGTALTLALRGAHVARLDDTLMIMPFGAFCRPDQMDGERTYNPLGMVAVNHARPNPAESVWGVQSVLEDGYMHAAYAADASVAMIPFKLPHGSELGAGDLLHVRLTPDIPERSGVACFTTFDAEMGEMDKGQLAVLVAQLASSALVVLKALFLMDTPNVEVVQAPLERQARRQAERKGHPIALAVKVHTSSKRYVGKANGNGDGHLEYSHRFRVRGHMKHYPVGTRMADAKPHEVKHCPRCGRCRRIWTPPFIKGPDDKPLVLKSLVLDE